MLARLAAGVALAAACPAQFVFTQPGLRHFPLDDAQSTRTALGDFDGDGDLDAVGGVFHPTNGSRRFYRNDGHGVFRPDAAWPDVPGNSGLLVADYDNDGDQDVLFDGIAARFQGGTYTTVATLATGVPIACADFDGDGLPDLLTRSGNGLGVSLWRQVIGGTFAPMPTPTTTLKDVEAEARDFDGDTRIDLLLTAKPYVSSVANWPGQDRLWLNGGNGAFAEVLLPGAANTETLSLAVADFDGDGDQDAVLLEVPLFWAEWRLRLNNGTGSLPVVTGYLPAGIPTTETLRAADLDLDGDPDLVGRDVWLVNDGTAHFTLAPIAGTSTFGQLQAVGDVDGDGDNDLVLGGATVNDGMNRLLLNDGTASFVDATRFPWTQPLRAAAIGDLDGDGDLDVIGQWPGPVGRNDGTGSFVEHAFPWGTQGALPVLLLDADLDGDLDAMFRAGPLVLCTNNGNALFTNAGSAGLPAITSPYFRLLATIDADGDGDQDVVAADQTGLLLLTHQAGGVFAFANGAFAPVSDTIRAVAVADFDGDGDQDVLSGATDFTSAGADQVRYYANNGAGQFTDVTVQRVQAPSAYVLDLDAGDIDGDGDVDVFVSCWGTPSYPNSFDFVLRNTGGNLAHVPGLVPLTLPSGTAALGDLDLDGDLDAVAGTYQGGIRFWQNQGVLGFVDVGGMFPPPSTLNAGPLGLVDVDDDGDLDLLVGSRLLTNEHWGLTASVLPRIGRPFELELRSASAAGAVWAVSVFGTQQARLPLPPFGVLGMAPASAVLHTAVPLTAGNGSFPITIPANPGLVGATLFSQMLYLTPTQLHLSQTYSIVVQS